MKKIEAIIKPFHLEGVHRALQEAGLAGMTVSEIMDFGEPSSEFSLAPSDGFSPRLKLEVVVSNEDFLPAIDTLRRTGGYSRNGLVVQQLDDVIRIRTQEHGEAAI